MASWEDTKRAAQSIYSATGRGFEDVHGSIGSAYQQILIAGHLYPPVDRNALSREIAEDAYEPTAEDWKEYEHYLDEKGSQEPEPPEPHEPEM